MLLTIVVLPREHLVGREEIKAELLEKRRSCPSSFSPYMNLKGPEDSLDIFPVKVRVILDCVSVPSPPGKG